MNRKWVSKPGSRIKLGALTFMHIYQIFVPSIVIMSIIAISRVNSAFEECGCYSVKHCTINLFALCKMRGSAFLHNSALNKNSGVLSGE